MDRKYYIRTIDTFTNKSVIVEVSKEIYTVINKSYRKEKYFSKELKQEKLIVDQSSEKIIEIKSREDSIERLEEELSKEFSDVYVLDLYCEKRLLLQSALKKLDEEELKLINNLYFKDLTERDYSKKSGIPQKTINYRKRMVLKKLNNILNTHSRSTAHMRHNE